MMVPSNVGTIQLTNENLNSFKLANLPSAFAKYVMMDPVPRAFASISYEIKPTNVNGDCEHIGGTWNAPTCTLGSALTLNSGDSLTIDSGAGLTITTSGTIHNSGTITILGVISNDGTINNIFSIVNFYIFNNPGKIINTGFIENAPSGGFDNFGPIINNGHVQNDGTFTNHSGITISNYGLIFTSYLFYNDGTITDYCGGTFSGNFFGSPAVNGCTPPSIPEFPFSFSLVIIFVAVAAVYMGIRQKMIPNFKI
ncbi:MAG TPA: hypothetical protein VEU72_09950 [Nitrosopumilaceae archaeon]|nr:hypothetical protein [Nitrosopumilaceae archaeon]